MGTTVSQTSVNNFWSSIESNPNQSTKTTRFNKLAFKLLNSTSVSNQKTIFIYDWDDTLLCTSNIDKINQVELEQCDSLATSIIEYSIAKGNTFIITNAEKKWVYISASRYYPKLHSLLPSINVISARDRFENTLMDVCDWKRFLLDEIYDSYYSKLLDTKDYSVIAMGDSVNEMNAAYYFSERFEKAKLKTIKFRYNPKPDQLIKELKLVLDSLDHIVQSKDNLKITVEKKPSIKSDKKKKSESNTDS